MLIPYSRQDDIHDTEPTPADTGRHIPTGPYSSAVRSEGPYGLWLDVGSTDLLIHVGLRYRAIVPRSHVRARLHRRWWASDMSSSGPRRPPRPPAPRVASPRSPSSGSGAAKTRSSRRCTVLVDESAENRASRESIRISHGRCGPPRRSTGGWSPIARWGRWSL